MRNLIYLFAAIFVWSIPVTAWAGACDEMANTQQKKSGGFSFGKDTLKTTAIGAGLGGLIGNQIGQQTGDRDATKETQIGILAGTIAGVAVGQVAEQRRAKFESESAFLDCEIENANKTIAARDAELSNAKAQLAAAQQEVANLNTLAAQGRAQKTEINRVKSSLFTQISSYSEAIDGCQRDIDYLTEVSSQTASAQEDSGALELKRQTLLSQRADLQVRFNELNRIRDEDHNSR